MFSREHILQLLRQVKPDMEKQYHVRSMALFGSYSRNEQTGDSDVDLLVDFAEPISGFAFVDFAETLEARLGLSVDVVPAGGIKPRYREYIQGELVYV
jgi:predicted nucleotidyltransferase